ncbi:ABC transporter permease, partial [Pseudomonas protegens]
MLGKHANAQMIADMRHEMGFDRPLFWQYVDFLKQIVTFDFGRSYASKQLISKMILDGAPVSLCYTLPAFVIAMLIS